MVGIHCKPNTILSTGDAIKVECIFEQKVTAKLRERERFQNMRVKSKRIMRGWLF